MSCLVKKIKTFFSSFPTTYTSELERYIIKHQPQNVADVEKLMFEFTLKKGNVV